jgi:hypothetical protein
VTSGVWPPATDVTSRSWAMSHAMAVTFTVTSGYSSVKRSPRMFIASPSAPIPQTSMVPDSALVSTSAAGLAPVSSLVPQLAAAIARARTATAMRRGFLVDIGDPPAGLRTVAPCAGRAGVAEDGRSLVGPPIMAPGRDRSVTVA